MIIAVLLNSCYTPFKAQKDINKAYNHHPDVVAKFAQKEFPCIETSENIIHDTSYDFIEILCPNDTTKVFDTVILTKIVKQKVNGTKIVKIPSETITIYRFIKDSAELKISEMRLQACSENGHKLQKNCDKNKEWIKWLLVIIAVLCLSHVLRSWI
jgi:hypothetical protein